MSSMFDRLKTDYTAHLAQTGMALPDGSFRIRNRDELRAAVKKWPTAKDPEAAKKHIIARARSLRAEEELPHDWLSSQYKTAAFTQTKTVIAKFAAVEAASGKPGPLQIINQLLADPEFPEIVKARTAMNPLMQSLKNASPAQRKALAEALYRPLLDDALKVYDELVVDMNTRIERLEKGIATEQRPRPRRGTAAQSTPPDHSEQIESLEQSIPRLSDIEHRKAAEALLLKLRAEQRGNR